jgi:hypothetical protein
MATKTTWTSDGDEWVFEEGKSAKVTPRGESRARSADFRVLKVINAVTVETDLKGLSSYGWEGPVVWWAGVGKLELEKVDGDENVTSSGDGEGASIERSGEA